jgi:prolyl-tRNA synthetase
MTHADDDGMVMPPKLAPQQVVLVPILRDEADRGKILSFCENISKRLAEKDIRVSIDRSEDRTPDKIWRAIKKGVPVRVEIGGREVDEGKVTYARRDLGKEGKAIVTVDEFVGKVPGVLAQMQKDMLARAADRMKAQCFDVKSLKEARDFFAAEKQGVVCLDYSLVKGSEEFDAIKKEFSVSPRCLPFEDEGRKVIVGKAY